MKVFSLDAIELIDDDSQTLVSLKDYVAENAADTLEALKSIIGTQDGFAEAIGKRIVDKLAKKVRQADKQELREKIESLPFDELCLMYAFIKVAKAHKEISEQ